MEHYTNQKINIKCYLNSNVSDTNWSTIKSLYYSHIQQIIHMYIDCFIQFSRATRVSVATTIIKRTLHRPIRVSYTCSFDAINQEIMYPTEDGQLFQTQMKEKPE